MEMARDEVRVMTVHGAKGLEAKNVILVDTTTTRPEGAYPPRLLTVPLADAAPDAAGLIWGVAKDKDAGPMAQARGAAIEAAKDEYRRLLYVGLTRAAERLVVCGTKGVNKIPEGCWYELVADALKPLSTESRDRRRQGLAFPQARARRRGGADAGRRNENKTARLAHAHAAGRAAARSAPSRRPPPAMTRHNRPATGERPNRGAAARHADAPAAAIAARHARRTPQRLRRKITWREPASPSVTTSGASWPARRCSLLDAPRFARPVRHQIAAPKCRSSAGSRAAAKRCGCPARSTASRSPERKFSSPITRPTGRRRATRACRRPTCASSRCYRAVLQKLYPTKHRARRAGLDGNP